MVAPLTTNPSMGMYHDVSYYQTDVMHWLTSVFSLTGIMIAAERASELILAG